MNWFSIISLILGIVEPVLTSDGIIPSAYSGLVTGILNAIQSIKNELTASNGAITVTAATLMSAVAAGLESLVTAGALPASWGGVVVALANAAAAGTAVADQPVTKVDPNSVQPIAPIA